MATGSVGHRPGTRLLLCRVLKVPQLAVDSWTVLASASLVKLCNRRLRMILDRSTVALGQLHREGVSEDMPHPPTSPRGYLEVVLNRNGRSRT